jgi:hypothetical protein
MPPAGPAPAGPAARARAGAAGATRVVLRCLGWGTTIGTAAGGIVGAYYILVGAVIGAPVGAVVGLAISVPVAPIVVVVCRRSAGETACRRTLAEVFASLLLLVAAIPAAVAVHVLSRGYDAGGGPGAAALVVGLSLPPLLAMVRLLRSANRSISAAWYRGTSC